MNLSTVARVKAVITSAGSASTAADAEIAAILATVSGAVERYLARGVESMARTEYFDVEPCTRLIRLHAFPVTVLTSVHFDPDQAFGSSTALTSTDYTNPVLDDQGLMTFRFPFVSVGRRALKVVYTGGMAASAAAFVTAYPDIAGAVDTQTSHEWQRRNALGMSSVSYPDGTTASLSFDRWIPSVKQVLDYHRRIL